MTREEKISILRQVKDIIQRSDSWMIDVKNAVNEAFESAIEALQTKSCEDAISRQKVIDIIDEELWAYDGASLITYAGILTGKVEKIPSVTLAKDINVTTTDAISRQATLLPYAELRDDDVISVRTIRDNIKYLLPVQPQKVGKWIPVTERLPEKSGNYLITYKCGVTMAYYYTNGSWMTKNQATHTVTAWMPLPNPWKGEEECKS